MRVLVTCSIGGAGHLGPLRPVIAALGDDVTLVLPDALAATAGVPCAVVAGAGPDAGAAGRIRARLAVAAPADAVVLGDRELFGRLATAAMLPTVTAVAGDLRPEVLVREPCEYASAVVAARRGVPAWTVAISLAGVESGALTVAAPAIEVHRPGLAARIRAWPYLTRLPEALDPSPFPSTHRFAERAGTPAGLPDWWPGRSGPLVYATLGSVTGGLPVAGPAYRCLLDALVGVEARVLLTVGRRFDPARLGPVPAHVHVEAWVPHDDVLARAHAVVCHGGSGTLYAAVAAGVPAVVVPLFADQAANGERVAAVGAAVVVATPSAADGTRRPPGPDESARITAALTDVLGDPRYREAAGRLAAATAATPALATVLDGLADGLDAAAR